MSKRPAKPRAETAEPVRTRAAPDDWQYFWDGDVTPLAEQQAHEATQLRARDAERRKKGADNSAQSRAAKVAERNKHIRKLAAAAMTAKQIEGDAGVTKLNGGKTLSASSIRRILAAN